MDKVKVFALGGLDESGKNMYCIEVNNVIFVIEAGIMIPDTNLLGVEFIIPDFTYLIENIPFSSVLIDLSYFAIPNAKIGSPTNGKNVHNNANPPDLPNFLQML